MGHVCHHPSLPDWRSMSLPGPRLSVGKDFDSECLCPSLSWVKLVLSLKKLRNTHNSQLHCMELDCKCSENWTRGGRTVCDLLLQISMKVRQSRTLTIKTHDSWPGRASESESVSCSVVSANSLQPHGLEPAKLLCPRDSPGTNTGVGSHSLLQGIFLTQGLNPGLLHCRQIHYHLSHPWSWRLQELSKPWFILWSDLQGRAQ